MHLQLTLLVAIVTLPGVARADCLACPVDPATGAPVSPNVVQPVVFFAAHPDDETIGMAAAIMHEVDQGRPVFIDLMTHGETSTVRNLLRNGVNDQVPFHTGNHDYKLGVADFGDARVREFLDSAARMGVTGVYVNSFPSEQLTVAQVSGRIQYWLQASTSPTLRGVAGSNYLDPGTAGGTAHVDHVAVWDALVQSGHPTVRGYLVYNYRTHLNRHHVTEDHTNLCLAKLDALDAYRLWDPPNGRYAIGYHSTPYLMGGNNVTLAPLSCPEFMVYPPYITPPPPPPPGD